MKKLLLFSLTIFTILIIAACGTEDSTKDESSKDDAVATETGAEDAQDPAALEPTEPTSESVCDSCNMVVYPKDHEMGAFSAQGITKDGETVFFDDIGCLLNYERKNGEPLQMEWVRDYITKDWTEIDAAVPVKADIETPMKWGYAFFDSQGKADQFIKENADINPALAKWDVIDQAAKERLEQKMKKQQEQNKNGSDDMNMDM